MSTGKVPQIRGRRAQPCDENRQLLREVDERLTAAHNARSRYLEEKRTEPKTLYSTEPFSTRRQAPEDEFRDSPEHAALIQSLPYTFRAETADD
jgi:hypothetical protein